MFWRLMKIGSSHVYLITGNQGETSQTKNLLLSECNVWIEISREFVCTELANDSGESTEGAALYIKGPQGTQPVSQKNFEL